MNNTTTTTYGYCRVSTKKQSLARQETNIKNLYPNATIITEVFTGTTTDRPEWNKLYKKLHDGDTVVFDEVSRMSRNAEEGFNLYQELFNRGVNLVFIKECTINTDVFKNTLQIATMGEEIADCLIEALNKVLWILAKRAIEEAFKTAEAEVDFLHQRISEGMREKGATSIKDEDGNIIKQGSISKARTGKTYTTPKSLLIKSRICQHAKSFGGTLSDKEIIEWCGCDRHTYYKYKKEIIDSLK